MIKAKIEFARNGGSKYIVIDKQAYVFDPQNKKVKNNKKITIDLTPVEPKKFELMVEGIVKKLASKVDVKELLRQALFETPLSELLLVKKELKKKKPKIKSEKHCLRMNIGKAHIWLRE